jgi:hypothetical protein
MNRTAGAIHGFEVAAVIQIVAADVRRLKLHDASNNFNNQSLLTSASTIFSSAADPPETGSCAPGLP